ncbi:MAG: amino acid permease [Dehalococcoidia bacterium]|nr:amino acid permease [Dehalococcoidia bacterium]
MKATDGRPAEPGTLVRSLGLAELTLAGLGVILGAGVYALIGAAAEQAGPHIWASFLLAALVTVFTGLSYAELAAAYPAAGAGFEYARRAFGIHVAFVVGWLTVTAEIVAGGTVALGFGGYLEALTSLERGAGAWIVLVAGLGIAATGALGSVRVAGLLTIVEASGLVLVSAIGFWDFDAANLRTAMEPLPILQGAALIFFAYIGFEDLATLSEEARDPQRSVPRAILISVLVATSLYVAVSLAAVGAVGADALAASRAPLALVAESALGARTADTLSIIALCATANTALLLVIAAGRHLYGMASAGALPGVLGTVSGRARVPLPGLVLACLTAAVVTHLGAIGTLADVTNFGLYIVFCVVNAAVIWRRRRGEGGGGFTVPGTLRLPAVGIVPVFPVLGIAVNVLFLAALEPRAIVSGAGLLLLGAAVAVAFRGPLSRAGANRG